MSTKKVLSVAFALAIGLSAGDAAAHNLGGVDASELAPATRSSLASDVQRARAETPELFRQVADIAKRANELDAASRVQGAPFTMHFKQLGPRALLPMLDMLAWGTAVPSDLTATAKSALRVGLVEAVGIVRDARAVPVLARIAAKETPDAELTRAAADALGRIGTDEAFGALGVALAAAEPSGGERYHAILMGVGASRRTDAVSLLAKKADAKPDEATARAIAKALGVAGNAWAWKTFSDRSSEAAVRESAARTLVRLYTAYAGEARAAAAKALLVVDDAHTAAFVAEARKAANADTQRALDELSAKLAKNPTR
ncbi:MAG: hypothetical protein JST00_13065 [Deltaproteobacteria bacterium]|nr:hypothetical protein [Deltaproteobacteria bacterium]